MPRKPSEKNKIIRPQLLRGMKDILPEDQIYWDFIRDKVSKFALDYGFKRIDTPILEETNLFVRSVGEETDIVGKEMFSFTDKGGDNVSLRPECTAPIARAYIEHGMLSQPQPVKLFYFGPFFRHDRPQAGRLRQFHQFGFEILGDANPVLDSQLILLVNNFYKEVGLEINIQINSLGCRNCQESHKKMLTDFYRQKRNSLCEDCKKRLLKNPLRILDCKNENCQILSVEAPQFIDHLCEECHAHFVIVLEYLDDLEIPYTLNSHLVRGLDYYTKTTFEIWLTNELEREASGNALGGGGRYDNLTEVLGGGYVPAIGYAGGIERLIIAIKEKGINAPSLPRPDIFLAQLGDNARKRCLKLFEDLRSAGILASESFSKDGLKNQIEIANKQGIKYTLILGQKEMMDETILLRDMESGIQETIDYNKIIPEIKKRLMKVNGNNIVKSL